MAQVVDRGLVLNARGDYVETLVDSLAAGGLRTDDTATMSALDARAAELASALEAANLKLTGLVVERQND